MPKYLRLVSDAAVSYAHVRAEPLVAAAPKKVRLVQQRWSGAFVGSLENGAAAIASDGDFAPYQFPGGIYLDPSDGSISICYGQGRLQDAFGPTRVILLAELPDPADPILAACARAQFDGPLSVTLDLVDEPTAGFEPEPVPDAQCFRLTLDDVEVRVQFSRYPALVESLRALLPLTGTATNTHSSGPLIRFWNQDGGREGRTPLEPTEDELRSAQSVLYPGHVYFLPKPTHAGLRIVAREPAIMRSPTGGPGLSLLDVGRIVGLRDAFDELAAGLTLRGALPMTLDRI